MAVILQILVHQAVSLSFLQGCNRQDSGGVLFQYRMTFGYGADCHVSSYVITRIVLFSQSVLR